MEDLFDLFDEKACTRWVNDMCQREIEKLLFGVPLAEIPGTAVKIVFKTEDCVMYGAQISEG